MNRKSEPWYIHAVLYVIIIALVLVLVQVSIIEPTDVIKTQTYHKTESRARMLNLMEAQMLYEKKNEVYSDNLDTLVNFIKYDSSVALLMAGFDTLYRNDSMVLRTTSPFHNLTTGEFTPESLYTSPRSGKLFIVQVDTLQEIDTIINRRGNIVKIDTNYTIGTKYVIESPDSKDKIGDLDLEALKNTTSWN